MASGRRPINACPEPPQGAEFGERQKFIGICHKKKCDLVARLFQQKALCFEKPQIFDSRGDHAPKFLGFPRACLVIGPPIGEEEVPSETRAAQEFVRLRQAAPGGQYVRSRKMPNRIVAEIHIE